MTNTIIEKIDILLEGQTTETLVKLYKRATGVDRDKILNQIKSSLSKSDDKKKIAKMMGVNPILLGSK